jgi:hypothetical protein
VPNWGLPALSWLVSFYFLSGFALSVGFPPRDDPSISDLVFCVLWLLFLFLPFISKIKIGGFLELEREVAQAKAEVKDFKEEVRTSLSVISTNINTIGNLSNQVTVNLPGSEEIIELRRKVDELTKPKDRAEAQEIRTELAAIDGEDRIMALARTRIRLEHRIRQMLGKRTTIESAKPERDMKFMSLGPMTRMLFEKYPQHKQLEEPMRYVLQVCNAAVHAQRISAGQAEEALDMGARILAILD